MAESPERWLLNKQYENFIRVTLPYASAMVAFRPDSTQTIKY